MNDRGQFGRGPGSSRTPENPLRSSTPISVPLPKDVVRIAAGGHYAMAIRSNGEVLAWGPHPGRPQGTYDVSMMTLAGLPPVAMVDAGGEHALALTRTGEVYAWGRNNNGEVGTTPVDPFVIRKPTRVAGLDNVVSIACEGTTNFGFSGAVKADGTVWMWGSNQSATFGKASFWGNGGPDDSVVPTPTKVAGITTARTIVAGPGHVVVLLKDSTLRLWGHDGWGQIGVGTSGFYQPSPKKPAIVNVSAVYTVGNRTFAVKTDGTIWWWGVAASRVGGPYSRDAKVPMEIAQF
jgi:alpha-tubulin suppressor-like RCC1 family protein